MNIFAAALLLLAAGQDFSYEIRRAKTTLGDYGDHLFRDERVHRRIGVRGSMIQTFCATTQRRNEEGRVDERPFYWVVRVRPAPGHLSDYERGAWQSPPEDDHGDFGKLCVDEGVVDDAELLRSKNHTSSGSTYDPTADAAGRVTSDWAMGTWVSTGSCATSRDLLLRSDGHFDRVDDRGRWKLIGDALHLSITDKPVFDEGTQVGYAPLARPKTEVLKVVRLGVDRMRTGRDVTLLRC